MARVFHAGHRPGLAPPGIVALEPQEPLPSRPGDTGPTYVSYLRFPDVLPISEQVLNVAEEIGGLLCLCSRRRVVVPLEVPVSVKGGNGRLSFLPYGGGLDRELNGPLPPDIIARFEALLANIATLSDSKAASIGSAVMLHYAACALVERDVRSAYVLLVAAIELLSREFGLPSREWSAWEDGHGWDELFGTILLTEPQRSAIRARLLANRQLRLKRTFIEYGAETIPDSFWSVTFEQWGYTYRPQTNDWGDPTLSPVLISQVLPKDRAILARSLARTYDARSAYVHRGSPFDQAASLRRRDIPVDGSQPLPYQLLRVLVRELLLHQIGAAAVA